MAQLLAPYNNAMRLGQGFNSYTQQICIDNAVSIDPNWRPEEQRTEAITLGVAKQDSKQDEDDDSENEAYEIMNRFEAKAKAEKDKLDREYAANKARLAKEAEKKRAKAEEREVEDTAGDAATGTPDAGADGAAEKRKYHAFKKQDVVKGNFNYQAGEALSVLPWVKPQIVTYTSKFVDKLSDVTDSMNISGSLSIQTAQIGGKANGSYLDSDKFKSSDINFYLQVKVTNQIHKPPEYTKFNKCSGVDASSFPEIYGDCFISGWEEGGEMNAVISVKVRDKSNIFKIKAGLEAELNTPSIAGKVTANLDLEKSNLSKETETTITVNWSGGGSIKDPMQDWSIGTLKQAAAAFPELVAITPQRTYAILTKYTTLSSFHTDGYIYSPLQYENAGLYTNSLLDAFMDYKVMWKQISQATDELEAGRASIELGRPSEEIYGQAVIKIMSQEETDLRLIASRKAKQAESSLAAIKAEGNTPKSESSGTSEAPAGTGEPSSDATKQLVPLTSVPVMGQDVVRDRSNKDVIPYTVFENSFVGLIKARRACRFEMSKIVNEVGLVAKDPSISTDTRRDDYFLNPLVFKQLLPVVRSLSPENARMGIRDPNAAIILGYCAPDQGDRKLPPLFNFASPVTDLPQDMQSSIKKNAYKADDYRMEGIAGKTKDIHSRAVMFNTLDQLDATYRPSSIGVWTRLQQLMGIKMYYANGKEFHAGNCDGPPAHSIQLAKDGSEYITQITIETSRDENNKVEIIAIELCTSNCQKLSSNAPSKDEALGEAKDAKTDTQESSKKEASTEGAAQDQSDETSLAPKKPKKIETQSFSWYKRDGGNWSLRGFFGYEMDKKFLSLGVVWGKAGFVPVPRGTPKMPLAKDFLCQSSLQEAEIQRITTLYPEYLGKFLMGDVLMTEPELKDEKITKFNAMDTIDTTWKIKSLGFAAVNRKLTGIQVTYLDGTEVVHGHYSKETRAWKSETKAPLISVKISAGRLPSDAMTYVNSIEFVKGDAEGRTPEWIFDMSTFRYLGEGEEGLIDQTSIVESAPKIGDAVWTIRGFYGEFSATQITHLGVIWGRG
ncbi:hypothetical protein TWF696_000279 [Orbilia brochopaga]|uniref:Uncharacterized protein n=1 Tax=Orbilia brochopaga TaxID=3140254 RepID=A0AAV9VAU5_9PEZI